MSSPGRTSSEEPSVENDNPSAESESEESISSKEDDTGSDDSSLRESGLMNRQVLEFWQLFQYAGKLILLFLYQAIRPTSRFQAHKTTKFFIFYNYLTSLQPRWQAGLPYLSPGITSTFLGSRLFNTESSARRATDKSRWR